MSDSDLLKEFIRRQLIDAAQAEKVERDSKTLGRSVEELLYERRLIDEVSVAKAKAEIFGAPYKKINAAELGENIFKIIPRETAVSYRIAPIELNKSMLIVGMLRPDDRQAADALKFIAKQLGVSLGVYILTPSDLAGIWRRYAPYKTELEAAVQEAGAVREDSKIVSLDEGGKGEDAPIIKIVSSTLKQAVEAGASDIHIEPQRNRLRVRFRIDGDLQEAASLPESLTQQIISRIKVLTRLKLDENRIPQDGRFRTNLFGRDIDYRVSTFPSVSGEKVAIRVLDSKTGLKSLDQLGLAPYNAKILEGAINSPYGMILISGPTGSGKTTTLYAIMQKLNSSKINAVSLEDPVEYFMEGVNQSQVKPEIGYDFSSGLRQILRQDPDVIMVGEIRDKETANLAVNAALTGHVMLSTIHTNNSIGVIPRLVDLGVPPFLLSSALNIMIAQRLVLVLCPECKQEYKASAETQTFIEENLRLMPEEILKSITSKPPYTLWKAAPRPDCKTCKGKGTAGRISLFEILRMTREMSDLISKGFSEGKLWDEARRQGIVTLREDGIIKALEGKISIEEVMRETV